MQRKGCNDPWRKRKTETIVALCLGVVAALGMSAALAAETKDRRDGDRPSRIGPREGDGAVRKGPRDGEGPARKGPRDGDRQGSTEPRKEGASDKERSEEQNERTATAPRKTDAAAGQRAKVEPLIGGVNPQTRTLPAPPTAIIGPHPFASAAASPSLEDVRRALQMAIRFFRSRVALDGGYLWEYSGDLALREAEGRVNDSHVWVQPPGTPTIGEAFLDAYEATGDEEYLNAALDAARVLLAGQMRTGGWGYSVETDPVKRQQYAYRDVTAAKAPRWNRATVLDDDTTMAALRFLMRLDKILQFKNAKIHDAAFFALDSLLLNQYPNGSWFGWWEWENRPPNPQEFPVRRAAYPDAWPRKPEGWPARYVLNDNVVSDAIRTMLDAWDIYRDERYLASAHKAGGFLLSAQMPDPQPAWAQQYDANMYPCWGRKFEPPAITAGESQTVIETLLALYRRTGDWKYLEPIPRALAYLKKSLLPDGHLARFYELRTNRSLYFTRDYQLTYTSDDVPTHYAFTWESRLDAIEADYRRVAAADPASLAAREKPEPRELAARVGAVLAAMDSRGAWVEGGPLRFHKIAPPSGVIKCATFAANVKTLCDYLAARR